MKFLNLAIGELITLSNEGGWVFWALIVLAFGIAFALLSLWHAMRFTDSPILTSKQWKELLLSNAGELQIPGKLAKHIENSPDRARRLQEIGQTLFSKPDRRFPFAFVLIGSAPLVGLLGTVSGMFTTFSGMASQTVRSPIDVISTGISEALITTQTGLVIGIPTLIVCSWLKSRYDHLVLAFHRLESRLLQSTASPT